MRVYILYDVGRAVGSYSSSWGDHESVRTLALRLRAWNFMGASGWTTAFLPSTLARYFSIVIYIERANENLKKGSWAKRMSGKFS